MALVEYADGVMYNKREDAFLIDKSIIDGVDDVGELEVTGDTIKAMNQFRNKIKFRRENN